MSSLALIPSLFEYNYWSIQRSLTSAARLNPALVTSDAGIPHSSLWATPVPLPRRGEALDRALPRLLAKELSR